MSHAKSAKKDTNTGRDSIPKGTGQDVRFNPLADRVLVKRLDPEDIVRGGIIVPDSAKEKPMEGRVIAVGTGRITDAGKRVPLDVKRGDRVLIGKYSGTEVKLDDEEHVILREDEILGVIS